ncbi:MAG TPA: AAA family ATPase [Pirellulales bacterium]|nr:AAA family ATPase [Pirellulales bacterium]
MYLNYWQLQKRPFGSGATQPPYIPSSTHEEALARLQYLVESRSRLGLLLGAPGSGKSFLLDLLSRQLRRVSASAPCFSLQGLSAHEMLWTLAAMFGLHPDRTAKSFDLWLRINDQVAENRCQGIATVILLDDADVARRETLEEVVRLARGEPGLPNRLTLVLAGRTDRMSVIGRQLLELTELRIDLAVWEFPDTENYVRQSLLLAGRKNPAFSTEGLLRLHELSEGAVRRAALLADLALLAAAGEKLPLVDAHTVQAVYDELGVMDDLTASGAQLV